MMRVQPRFAAFIVFGLLSSLSFAGRLPERFTLGRYIPGDVWLYSHTVHNPERTWLDKEWQEVLDALKASGIDQDIKGLILALAPGDERAEWDARIERAIRLIEDVRWGELVASEFAVAERLGTDPIHLDYILLARGKADSAEANAAALAAILKELAGLSDEVQLTEREQSGATVWSLTFQASVDAPFRSVELFRKGDVVALATSSKAVSEILVLMAGKAQKRAIVDMPRFAEALGQVEAPEDSLAFFDFKRLLESVHAVVRSAAGKVHRDQEDALKMVRAIANILERFNVMDYSVVTVETEGRRQLTHSAARVQKGKMDSALACCILDRKPFTRFDEFVPSEAIGFSLDGFLNLEELYKFVVDFIEKELPEGQGRIAQWNDILAKIGFDPQRDLFSWWSGEVISVSLPPAVAMLMGGNDGVLMFRVKDSETAARKVDAAINFVNRRLRARGQMLMISSASVNTGDFREVTHPIMAAFVRPVIGVHGDWLIIGTSAAAINKCLDVAAGRAPSIRENERFRKEGLAPTGPVVSASFSDESRLGHELGAGIAIASMVGSMLTASLPDSPKTRTLKQLVQRLAGIGMKLSPVLQKIDFYRSRSSVTTFDGERTLRTERVVTFRPPSADEISAAKARPR